MGKQRTRWVVTALVASCLAGCRPAGTGPAPTDQSAPPQALEATVTRRDIVGTVRLRGPALAPATEYARIASPYRAPVKQVMVTVGATVKEGDVLLQLSYPNADAYLQEASAKLEVARSTLATETRRLDAYVQSARASLKAAQAQSRASDGPMGQQYAAALLVEAQQQVQEAEAYRDAAAVPYRQQVAAAERVFKEAQQQVKVASIRTPIDGQVIAVHAEEGQMVGEDASAPVVEVADLSALKITAQIGPLEYRQLKPGMPATLTFATLPNETMEGKVTKTMLDFQAQVQSNVTEPRYLALISFNNEAGKVKPEDTAEAEIRTGEARNVIAVRLEAVDEDEQQRRIVRVKQGDQWQPTLVETGLSDGEYIEIKSGLTEGQVVQVTTG